MTFTQKEQVLNVWLLSILSISQRVHLRSSASVIKRTSSYSVLSAQIQSARVSGLYYTYCRDQQYCRLKAVMQKQTNTEQGIQMNRKLRTSSGYNGLFTQCQQRKNAMALMQLLLSASATSMYAHYSPSGKHHFGCPLIGNVTIKLGL